MFSRPRTRLWAAGLSLASLCALLLAACGGSGTGSGPAQGTPITGGAKATTVVDCSNSDATTSGLHLVTPHELTIGSDTTYAPAEFVDPNNPTIDDGYDMDLARELARRLCLGPNIVTASFPSIITDIAGPALGQQPWDLSISSFTINSTRQAKVDMIPYFIAGESTLVQKGNPKHVTDISSMCGLTVSAQNGTVELFELQDANGTGASQNDGGVTQPPVCKTNPIKILSYDSEEDVIAQVISGRADAAYQDQPVTDYYISLHQGQLDPGYITTGSSGTEGIVVRKDNPALETALNNALNAMVQDGTYQRLMAAWGQTKLACLAATGGCPPSQG
jgi:polar amino acid transport system substrate-binding protein